MNRTSLSRKGQGSNTGNAGHFAFATRAPSTTVLHRTQDQLVSLIEERLPDHIEICAAGDIHDAWPMDSGDFCPAAHTDVSDFAENLHNTPDWQSNIESFTEAIPDDYLFCTRSFDAWSVGTMTPDDFVTVKDDPELVNEIHQAFTAAQSTKE